MKKLLPACFRGLICSVALLCMHFSTFASHIVGCDLFYTWITGNQYKVTVILYGNCGPLSSSAFSTLPTSTPYVCIWDGSTYFSTIHCAIEAPSAGVEITPVCPDDSESSQCWIPSSTTTGALYIPAIMVRALQQAVQHQSPISMPLVVLSCS